MADKSHGDSEDTMERRRTEEGSRQESPSRTNSPSSSEEQEEPKEAGPKIEPRREQRPERKARRDENVVFVGKKPTMSYVLAVITQFSEGNNEVFVKARGRSISTAIDVVEVTKKKFMQDLKCEIDTDTEVITDERNQKINVSTLSARLFK